MADRFHPSDNELRWRREHAAATISRLISIGTLLAAVERRFPELTRTEFMAALQDATAAAERRAMKR